MPGAGAGKSIKDRLRQRREKGNIVAILVWLPVTLVRYACVWSTWSYRYLSCGHCWKITRNVLSIGMPNVLYRTVFFYLSTYLSECILSISVYLNVCLSCLSYSQTHVQDYNLQGWAPCKVFFCHGNWLIKADRPRPGTRPAPGTGTSPLQGGPQFRLHVGVFLN